MSSLTSLGVNKNKKGFAPKINKRKDRKERKPAAASSSEKITAEVSLETEAPAPAIAQTESKSAKIIGNTSTAKEIIPAITTEASSAGVKLQPTPKTVSSAEKAEVPGDPKFEPLTEEELAINAAAASRKRRRPSHDQVVKAASPLSAPSPMAPVEKVDCNIEKTKKGAPFLKVERMTPDAKRRMRNITEEPQEHAEDATTEDLVRIRNESIAPKVDDNIPKIDSDDNVPKIDLDNDNVDYTDLLASGEDDEVDVDGDVPVERLMPVYIDVGAPTRKPRSAKSNAGSRLKATRDISQEDESDEFVEEEEDEEEGAKLAPKKKKVAKAKGREKEKTTTKKKSTKGTKASKKGGATAISIGIGVPTTSTPTTTVVRADSVAFSDDEIEVEYSSEDSEGNRVIKTRKKKRRGARKQYKYAYRLVENMRTLDDITNDPAPADNLEKPMSDFTKDIDGIVSKTFKEMETLRSEAKKKDELKSSMTEEELEAMRKKEEEEERIAQEKKDAAKAREEERRKQELDGKVLAESSNALQVRLVNGEIVLDTDTLVVERTEGDVNYGDDPMEIVEENSMTKKVNSNTYSRRKQSSRWDEVETDQFYECLSQFGTDFEMIAAMMPGRTRAQIRTKFNREEKICPEKVTEYMITKRKLMDLDKYKEMAGVELEAVPDDFHEMQLA